MFYKKQLLLENNTYILLSLVAGSSLATAGVCVDLVVNAPNMDIVLQAAHTFENIVWPDYYL